MRKFLFNYILVFSLLFSGLPTPRANAFIGGGDDQTNKMINVIYMLAVGGISIYKMVVCKPALKGTPAISFCGM